MGCERPSARWPGAIQSEAPCWTDYRALLHRLPGSTFPDCTALNQLLPADLCSHAGRAIRFHPSDSLDDQPYEERIFHTGQVSTRRHSWHDLFNALVWARFPRTKAAMNALHCRAPDAPAPGRRSRLRDGLTLFDECGLLVYSPDHDFLQALARHDWRQLLSRSSALRDPGRAGVMVLGHGLLEKFLHPYPTLTANSVLLRVDDDFMASPRARRGTRLDTRLARAMLTDEIALHPRNLSPLPLAALPGWWPDLEAAAADPPDPCIFRPPRPDRVQADIYDWSASSVAESRR